MQKSSENTGKKWQTDLSDCYAGSSPTSGEPQLRFDIKIEPIWQGVPKLGKLAREERLKGCGTAVRLRGQDEVKSAN